jgi:hypothetical protein
MKTLELDLKFEHSKENTFEACGIDSSKIAEETFKSLTAAFDQLDVSTTKSRVIEKLLNNSSDEALRFFLILGMDEFFSKAENFALKQAMTKMSSMFGSEDAQA